MKLIRDLLVLASGIISAFTCLNIGFGIAEFIRDNIPLIGHLNKTAMGL